MATYPNLNRAVFTITQNRQGWAVEHDGRLLDRSASREEVLASACRRARACNDQGRPAQIRIEGEHGFALR